MMKLINKVAKWRKIRKSLQGETIGFVATMGHLHPGHISLLKRSVAENSITVLSCFVNPTQFNDVHDFDAYPRTVQEDVKLGTTEGVDYLLLPNYHDLYPDDYRYKVSEQKISTILEGAHRPGHFDGMLTVVLKLLLLIKPDRAYFGEKDYQQLQLVEGLAEAFFLDTDIVPCKTIRDHLGLALSSRHHQLKPDQMKKAHYFPKYLHSNLSCNEVTKKLESTGFVVDYIKEHQGRRYGAVRLGGVRLIDNGQIDRLGE